MNGYLLDTHIVIFALLTPEKLSTAAEKALLSGKCVLSVVSYWEVMVKSMKGKLDVGDPRIWWLEALEQLTASPLSLHSQHISALSGLPGIHKDPHDRILIAQAITENLTLISTDQAVQRYASAGLRIIS